MHLAFAIVYAFLFYESLTYEKSIAFYYNS